VTNALAYFRRMDFPARKVFMVINRIFLSYHLLLSLSVLPKRLSVRECFEHTEHVRFDLKKR
jgi:hypothetical protein